MKDDAERAREIGSRLLQDKVWTEARERYLNDATQQDFENHLIRVAGEQAAMLAFAQQPEGWRPIDTAPRDATEFIAWMVNENGVGFWNDRCRFRDADGPFEVWGRIDYDEDGWDVLSHVTPTHWRPDLAPPAAMLDAAPIPGETSLQKTQTTAERVREACAKVADERAEMRRRLYEENPVTINAAKAVEAEEIAAAIRSLPIGGE